LQKIRILLVDDHAVLRDGVAALISDQDDMEVVAHADNGDDAITCCEEHAPDLVVMDLSMPGVGGIEATRRIRKASQQTRVLVLTMHDDQAYMRTVLDAGAAGYLVKHSAATELVSAIREVHAGRTVISVSLDRDGTVNVGPDGDAKKQPSSPLSERERDVLELVARGYTNREVAERLGVSKKTVDTYRVRLQDKLSARSRADIVRYALEHGILTPSSLSIIPPKQ
jgi:two-component system response regulator NreC